MGLDVAHELVPGLLDSAAAAGFSADNPANLKHWYDASVLASMEQAEGGDPVASDGDPVGNFICQVVAADNIVQTTTAAKPTYRAAIAAFGSKPALEFDGGDYLAGAWSASLSQPNTIFVVGQATSIAATKCFYDGDDASTRHRQVATTTDWRIGTSAVITGGTSDTNAHIFTGTFNTTSSVAYVDGVSVATGDIGTHAVDGLTLGAFNGGGNPLSGYIVEFLIYDANLSAADKNIVQNYLAAKYGISVTEFS